MALPVAHSGDFRRDDDGGALVSAGGPTGKLMAFDQQTGRVLWADDTGLPIGGGLVSYLAEGKQFIAAAAGLHAPRTWQLVSPPAEILIYSLPGSRRQAAPDSRDGGTRCRSERTHFASEDSAAPDLRVVIEPLPLLFRRVVPAVVVTRQHEIRLPSRMRRSSLERIDVDGSQASCHPLL